MPSDLIELLRHDILKCLVCVTSGLQLQLVVCALLHECATLGVARLYRRVLLAKKGVAGPHVACRK